MPVFDCPGFNCETVVVGNYSGLLRHVSSEHPLEASARIHEGGLSLRERIKGAQKERLKERIEREMVLPHDTADPE